MIPQLFLYVRLIQYICYTDTRPTSLISALSLWLVIALSLTRAAYGLVGQYIKPRLKRPRRKFVITGHFTPSVGKIRVLAD
jgi:hypothetical protein